MHCPVLVNGLRDGIIIKIEKTLIAPWIKPYDAASVADKSAQGALPATSDCTSDCTSDWLRVWWLETGDLPAGRGAVSGNDTVSGNDAVSSDDDDYECNDYEDYEEEEYV